MPQFHILSYVEGIIKVNINGKIYEYRASEPVYFTLKRIPSKAPGRAIQFLKQYAEEINYNDSNPISEKEKSKRPGQSGQGWLFDANR